MNEHLKQLKGFFPDFVGMKVSKNLSIILILFLLATQAFSVNASLQSVNVKLSLNHPTVADVVEKLHAQTGYEFSYDADILSHRLSKNVSVNVRNERIETILARVFDDSEISYRVLNNRVFLKSSQKTQTNTSLPASGTQQPSAKRISGTIVDVTGEPIIGATIIEKGNPSSGTITDVDGKFTLNVAPDAVLEISYVGYQSQAIASTGKTLFHIVLQEYTRALDEVVIVGYGTQRKVNLTGAISQVKMEEVLGDRPIVNAMAALQGTLPGLQISNNANSAGGPGQSKSFNIRGVTSLNGGSPLVLIDNVPGDVDMLNPEDIESVSILKDAASAAIYGARAAFGVILITTKRAKKNDRIQLNYNNNFGFQYSINRPTQAAALDMLRAYKDAGFLSGTYFVGQNIDKWIEYIEDYRKNPSKYDFSKGDGVYIPTENNAAGIRYYLNEKDLYDNMLDKYGFLQNHNISATGGSENISYRLSLGYANEQGILVTDKDRYKRITASSYISSNITPWLNQSVDIRYSKGNRSVPNAAGELYGMRLLSLTPEGDMELNDGTVLPVNTPRNYLLYAASETTDVENPRILSRTTLTPLKGLEMILEYTYDKQTTDWKKYNQPYMRTSIQLDKTRSASSSKYENDKISEGYNAINAFATYQFDICKAHNFKFMSGFNQEWNRFERLSADKLDMINENNPSFSSSTGETNVRDKYLEYAVRGVFYRLNYDYKGKYLFEANGRYDGSSKFPKKDRFGFFPSFSAGYNVAEENFMAFSRSWLNQLKLRASWGQVGNQAISPYLFLPTMDPEKAPWIVDNKQPITLKVPPLVSSSFTWETVETLDLGVDVTMFNNRLTMTYDWYRRDTKDMLAPGLEFPAVVGANAPTQNVADLRTKGWEISFNWRDKIGDVGYNLGFNLYDSRTRVTKYDNKEGLFYAMNSAQNANRYREGMEIGEIWGYVTDGYYSVNDFENTTSWKLKDGVTSIKGVNVKPGDVKFKNLMDDENSKNQIDEGLGTVNNPGDRTIIGNSQSRYQYGIAGGINWKGFALTFLLQGTGKRDVWISNDRRWAFNSNEFGTIFADQLDYWKPKDAANGDYTAVNPDAQYFRIYGQRENAGSNTRIQTKYLLDASYLRFKNITLSYVVPATFTKRVGLSGLKVFSSIENLHTWTSLPDGYDPERLNWGYPFYRTVSFGLNLTL